MTLDKALPCGRARQTRLKLRVKRVRLRKAGSCTCVNRHTRYALFRVPQVYSTTTLMAAEVLLDTLQAVNMHQHLLYVSVLERVRRYIERNTALLAAKWPRNAGAVYDMLQASRAARELLNKTSE